MLPPLPTERTENCRCSVCPAMSWHRLEKLPHLPAAPPHRSALQVDTAPSTQPAAPTLLVEDIEVEAAATVEDVEQRAAPQGHVMPVPGCHAEPGGTRTRKEVVGKPGRNNRTPAC